MKIEIEIINYNESKTDLIKKTINYYATDFQVAKAIAKLLMQKNKTINYDNAVLEANSKLNYYIGFYGNDLINKLKEMCYCLAFKQFLIEELKKDD